MSRKRSSQSQHIVLAAPKKSLAHPTCESLFHEPAFWQPTRPTSARHVPMSALHAEDDHAWRSIDAAIHPDLNPSHQRLLSTLSETA